MHILRLTHSVDAIRCLGLLRRIPPTSIMDDVIGLSKVQSHASNTWRKNYCVESLGLFEAVHNVLASILQSLGTPTTRHLTIQDIHVDSEFRFDHPLEQVLHVQ